MRVLVTAAGGAMGGAIAAVLAEHGPVFLTDISKRRLAATVEALRAAGHEANGYRADVTAREEATALVEAAVQCLGEIDVLVNVVGGYRGDLYEDVLDISEERFDLVMRLNLKGTFLLTQLVGRRMRDNRRGRIVNISSVAKEGASGQADYAAAKAGVVAFTRSCALELAPHVTVNAVAPGVIQTSVFDRLPESMLQRYQERIPAGEFGRPADVAAAVNFLASPDARYVTGEVIHVSGGFFGWL